MNPQRLRISSADRELHDAFYRFAPKTFRSADFRQWGERGGWTSDYEVFALAHDGELVSAVGLTRMHLVIHGEKCTGFQLGAVATVADQRGRGLSRSVLEWALQECDYPDQPVMLFANDSVLDFYPRFGFRRVWQRRYAAEVAIQPATTIAMRLDMSVVEHRGLLEARCARASFIGQNFAACNYYSTLLWHLLHRPLTAFWLPQFDAVVVASHHAGQLTLHDLLATRRFDLIDALSELTADRITRVEFGFNPESWWPSALDTGTEATSPLFVRGAPALTEGALRFPDLAHT